MFCTEMMGYSHVGYNGNNVFRCSLYDVVQYI